MTMDHLQIELAKLRRDANLKQSMEDVDKIIEQLERARETIIAGTKTEKNNAAFRERTNPSLEPDSASITLAKLQNPVQQGFWKVNEDLKKIHKGHNSFGKALDKVCIQIRFGVPLLMLHSTFQ